jgi:hypothetical protein
MVKSLLCKKKKKITTTFLDRDNLLRVAVEGAKCCECTIETWGRKNLYHISEVPKT